MNLGKTEALVTAAEDGWICGTGCLRVRLGPGVEPRYLIQFLRWPATVAWLEGQLAPLRAQARSEVPADCTNVHSWLPRAQAAFAQK